MGKLKIYLILLGLLFAAIIAMDAMKPVPIDWRPTYSIKDKIPLGLYVFDQELSSLARQKISKFRVTPYEYLDAAFDYDTLVENYKIKGTLLNISNLPNIDDESCKEIFNFVARGNAAFLSMKVLPKYLIDSLKVEVAAGYNLTENVNFSMANPAFGKKKYAMKEGISPLFFSKMDTLNSTVLGYMKVDSSHVNFIKVRYGEGEIYLHTEPAIFTNFHLLKDNHYEYAQQVLSYLPNREIFWYTKGIDGSQISDSPLAFIFSQPALKWAWLIFIVGMLVFIIFNAKRKQRVVPIIDPLLNTTVEFTKTIGNLFYQEGDHDAIIDKKIIYFLEKVRNDYLIDTAVIDDAFMRKLHQKSGKDMALIEHALFLVNAHRKSPHAAVEEDLIHINTALEKIIN